MILAVIPCSKEKIWDIKPQQQAVPAKLAYRSAFHRYARNYAQTHCNQHIIFSAKYGLIKPEFLIQGPYDVTFSRPNDPCISMMQLKKQALQYQSATSIWILCPKTYAQKLTQAFAELSPTLVFPLRNIGGFGCMHRFLKNNATTTSKP